MENKAIFAAGCFWGVQYYFSTLKGVTKTAVGYTGGSVHDPSYEQVCAKKTGHLEAIEISYDPEQTTYEDLLKFFFEIHDFEQNNGQGPDIGPQYLSAVFVQDEQQKASVQNILDQLKAKGFDTATKILSAQTFYPAEQYHQDYYQKNGHSPYCHTRRKIF